MTKFHPVQIILGSESDRKAVDKSGMLDILNTLDILWQISYVSAHSHADELASFCKNSTTEDVKMFEEDVKLFITAAGMMPALPGAVAGLTDAIIPVIGVPLDSSTIPAYKTVATAAAMPPGTPIIIPGYSISGLKNAAIVAAQILAVSDEVVRKNLRQYRKDNNPVPQIQVESSNTYKLKE